LTFGKLAEDRLLRSDGINIGMGGRFGMVNKSNKLILAMIVVVVLIAGIITVAVQMRREQDVEIVEQMPDLAPDEEVEEQVIQIPEDPELLFRSDFENNDLHGWKGRIGSEKLELSDATAKSGNQSLKITERVGAFNGPVIDVSDIIQQNRWYGISFWIKLLPDKNPAQVMLSAQRTKAGNHSFDSISTGVTVTSDEWVQVADTYKFTEIPEELHLNIETTMGRASFFIDDFRIRHLPDKPVRGYVPSLKEVFVDMFTIGAAVEPHIHLEGENREMLLKHYNVIVAENAMKPVSLQPTEGNFNWAPADRIRDFAQDNDMRLRFHALVWHNQVPEWFFIDREGNRMVDETDPVRREANKTLLLQRLETHIRAIIERYRDYVDYWEVVNEVIDPSAPDGMRNSQWYQITGKEFIKTAFRVAREAAGEDALLAINDYNTHQPRKRDFLYDLVMELRAEGIRVDIIGHQTHISIVYPSMALIGESIEKFAAAGFRNHVTELDISVYAYRDETSYNVVPDHLLAQLAIRYRDLFDIFRRLEAYIDDVTFWGIADNHTWLHNRPVPRRDAPLLFDEQFQPKDAFWAAIDPDWVPYIWVPGAE